MADESLMLEAHRVLGTTCLFQGAFPAAQTHLDYAIRLYDPERHRTHAFIYGQDPKVSALGYVAETLWLLGYPEKALTTSHESLVFARELSHPLSLAYALNHAARLHLHRREPHIAQQLVESGNALCEEHGLAFWLAVGTFERGWALCEQGQTEPGVQEMQRGLAAFKACGTIHAPPHYLGRLAVAFGQRGDAKRAVTTLDEAITAVQETDERLYEPELYRLRGEWLLKQSGHGGEEVEVAFRRALEVSRRQSAQSWQLRAAMSLSRLWKHREKRAEARALVGEAYSWFTEGFDTT